MTLKSLLKTTSKYVHILDQNGISSLRSLLEYFPRTYEDRREIKTLSEVLLDESAQTVKWKVIKKSMLKLPTGRKITEIQFVDEQEQKWSIQSFQWNFMLRTVKVDQWYYIIWKPALRYGKIVFSHPELMLATETEKDAYNFGRIYPIYSEMLGIKPSRFAKKIHSILHEALEDVTETLPSSFLEEYNLLPLRETYRLLHFPESISDTEQAKYRIFFEKLLKIQLISNINEREYKNDTAHLPQIDRTHIKQFLWIIPFELTWAQKKSLKEMVEDIHNGKTMMRLLQWDVWSWKTIVATMLAYHIIKQNWWQIAFLAPIEVLAIQHYRSLAKLLLPLGIRIELLTWSTTPKEKLRIKAALTAGQIDMIVGTHAIIQADIKFHDIQLAIIDEQHKFWVKQRAFFQRFWSPHLLQMTATPIPRSLTLAFFGEFDVSIIDEMPAGRKPIITKIINQWEFKKLKPRLLTKVKQWQKIFVITPLIEESEHLEETASVMNERKEVHEMLNKEILKRKEKEWITIKNDHTQIWLLHGKIKSNEKDEIMKQFKAGEFNVLVSTTVIEVGIDIPDATAIVIKNAERFWLSQLHQLRGRVWRSDLQSYCFLQTKRKSWDSYKRLRHMEETTDGFKLSEIDLQLRGTWEILGTRQSGETDIPLEILTDTTFLETVQHSARRLVANHPDSVNRIVKSHTSGSALV